MIKPARIPTAGATASVGGWPTTRPVNGFSPPTPLEHNSGTDLLDRAAGRRQADDHANALAADEGLTAIEARMPSASPASTMRNAAVGSALVVAASMVVGAYIALPLVLAARELLSAVPNAIALSVALIVLAVLGVLSVLQQTATAPNVKPPGVKRRSRRRGRHATTDRSTAVLALPVRRSPDSGRRTGQHRA
ncbi:hypothetical protein [Blastococcus mobilis]|uniref:Uncharacterized protein n=1 Tax=Blastococcus mobilis TaxID=1938746 RepID=A0A238W3U8_9ACTN|nr:hypothetical protein [Blastococcus mobilis]SNR40389.1 hypothetical protein SAMN06272737_10619 [Blastococcus mobilis]